MEYQIIDKEYGVQVIPVINAETIEADTSKDALLKALGYFGIEAQYKEEFLLIANLEAKAVN